MGSVLSVLFGLSVTSVFVCEVVLLIAAWRTGFDMGILTTFIPFYAVTTGNWRLRTERRKLIRNCWWASFVAMILTALAGGWG